LADETELYSGADLESLCREAALNALTNAGIKADSVIVTVEDFKAALVQVKPSLTKALLEEYESFRMR